MNTDIKFENCHVMLGDCLERMMKEIPDNSIDLTVTSPPYDNLRTYKGYSFDFEGIAKELYRITKDGGVVVWVVNDATIKGSETGTSFRQALYFKDICGFNLHDTMIYHKHNPVPNELGKRYQPSFEYMFVLSKNKPKTFNPIKEKAICYEKGRKPVKELMQRNKDGDIMMSNSSKFAKPLKFRHNVFTYTLGKNSKHPAIFPEQLAQDHIISWSNEGDIVFDPFTGSGTTAKMALLNNRKFIGCEIAEEYMDIIKECIETAYQQKEKYID